MDCFCPLSIFHSEQSQDAVGSVIGFNEFSLHAMRPVSSQAHPEGRMVLLVTLELPTGCADSFDDIQAYPHFAAHLLGDARKLCELAKLHYERKISSHFFGGHYCRKKDSLEAIAEVTLHSIIFFISRSILCTGSKRN